MKEKSTQSPCPCCSGAFYANCCAPYLLGATTAPTAVALMRSRYTAYVLADIGYLLKTWHPSTRPATIDPGTIPDWQGLRIIHSEGGEVNEAQGGVEFEARAIVRQKPCHLHERSRFVREDGAWFYVDGTLQSSPPPLAKATKVRRNAPCPCGSGKKSKKCCGL
jgi:SEC-C motif-containing protein